MKAVNDCDCSAPHLLQENGRTTLRTELPWRYVKEVAATSIESGRGGVGGVGALLQLNARVEHYYLARGKHSSSPQVLD